MKRIELLKKTGICFTALALSAAVSLSSPMMTVLRAEDTDGNKPALTSSAPNSDNESGEGGNEGGGSGNSGDQGSSGGSGNEGSGGTGGDTGSGENTGGGSGSGENPGGGSGSGENPGGGGEGGGEGGSGGTGGGDTGSGGNTGGGSEGSGESDSESGTGTEGGSQAGGEGSSGSGTVSGGGNATDGGSGSTSGGNSGTGSSTQVDPSAGNSGTGNSGTSTGNTTNTSSGTTQDGNKTTVEVTPGNENGNTTTGQPAIQDPNAVQPPNQLNPQTPSYPAYVPYQPQTPVTPADNTKRAGNLKDRETILNPGEVPTGFQQALNYTGTNDQLIANQNIVSGLSIVRDDFRFYTVDKNLAFSTVTQGVHEEMKSASRQVGVLSENDALYILSEEKDGWLYVESGTVRGFIKNTSVLRDNAARIMLDDLQQKLKELAELSGEPEPSAYDVLTFASETIPAGENSAYTYKRATTKSTVVDKQYAVAETDAPILEEMSENAREIGHMTQGDLCYVLMQTDDKWAYVESGNVRGFTPLVDLTTGSAGKKIVQERGEADMETAVEYVEPSNNAALYYTLNSVHDGVAYNNIRSEIVEIAAECIGNPYVWGGNSLTYGADCSGFVKTLYSMFGYEIPRVADDQSRFGTQIPISDAAPGDLIFFAENGYVYHVAMYAGDGMTIEAYSEDRGIIATEIGNRNAVWATRIIED